MGPPAAANTNESDPLAWMDLAACSGLYPEMFHTASQDTQAKCKKICKECPVVRECLEYAYPFDRASGWDAQLGIYGGMTIEERRLFWDRRRRANQPSRNWRLRKQRERESNDQA